ncbi:MAG: flavin-containing monooxygenase [Parasphingopyxis sp.]|uniref:flavin-containing monooxygenase n=1 Tax=Parasphingopyxis sp. TaxID=1920299 RepID=UPI003FA0C0D2
MAREDAPEHFDVVVVGAGISGIGAGYYLQRDCPQKSYVILEGRENIGGTWDLFRYPGIRSDSDMFTLGYTFKPWTAQKAIADGPSILEYLDETADQYDIRDKIRFKHHVKGAEWSSEDARWLVEAERDGETVWISCNFLFMCTGYYNYEAGYTPDWQDFDRYQGEIVHPQHWPQDLDYSGKRVVVIGSGATAVTLVPAMIDGDGPPEHVTMLQRSPTYMISRPSEDAMANFLRKWLPSQFAYNLIRWRNTLLQHIVFRRARNKPEKVKTFLLDKVQDELGPEYDISTHFTPSYNPWEQRLCLVPDSDFFRVIRDGRASVETGHIDRFTERGIRLQSGGELEADIVVTATGLDLQMAGGAEITVDGQPINFGDKITYKAMMFDDVPNLAFSFGYTNASWTLRADLTCEYVARLLNYMDANGVQIAVPRLPEDEPVERRPWVDFSSGYFKRAEDKLPAQGDRGVWRNLQNYRKDVKELREAPIADKAMVFAEAGTITFGPAKKTEPAAIAAE